MPSHHSVILVYFQSNVLKRKYLTTACSLYCTTFTSYSQSLCLSYFPHSLSLILSVSPFLSLIAALSLCLSPSFFCKRFRKTSPKLLPKKLYVYHVLLLLSNCISAALSLSLSLSLSHLICVLFLLLQAPRAGLKPSSVRRSLNTRSLRVPAIVTIQI